MRATGRLGNAASLAALIALSACGGKDNSAVPDAGAACAPEDPGCMQQPTNTPPSAGTTGQPPVGVGGAAAPQAGTGGASGTLPTPDEDAGLETPGDGGTSEPSALPMDGNQGAVCETDRDCNMGMGCVSAGAGRGFCSKSCQEDADCVDLSGAEYTCAASDLCSVACEGLDDTASCPEGMTCVSLGGFGGGFHCQYPEASVEQSAHWGPCMDPASADCEDGLTCNGLTASPSGTGYCTQECSGDLDCSVPPSSGSIDPSCAIVFGFGGGTQLCVLDCSQDDTGCPDGMTCVPIGGGSARCEYE